LHFIGKCSERGEEKTLYWKIEEEKFHVPRYYYFFFLFAGEALYKNISPCDAFYFSPTVFLAFLCGVMALSVQTPVNLSVSESVSHNEGGERNHDDDAAIPRPPVPSHAHKISRLLCCQPDDSVS